jgi:hypothetical protein
MELAGLEPATSWVRSRRFGIRNVAMSRRFAGISDRAGAALMARIAGDSRGFLVVSGTLRDECLNSGPSGHWTPRRSARTHQVLLSQGYVSLVELYKHTKFQTFSVIAG